MVTLICVFCFFDTSSIPETPHTAFHNLQASATAAARSLSSRNEVKAYRRALTVAKRWGNVPGRFPRLKKSGQAGLNHRRPVIE